MKKSIAWVVVLVIVIALGWWAMKNKTPKPASGDPIKIGAILPLTGDFALWGDEFRKGMDIAVKELNDKGIKTEIIYEDDQSLSPQATVSAADKLLNINKVDIGVTLLIEEARPIMPKFNDKKVPLLVLWDSNKSIQEAGPYIFSNGFSTELAGELMAQYAYEKLNLRNIALIEHIDPWSEIISKAFSNRFSTLGGKIAYNEKFQPSEDDYRTAISKIKSTHSDGVYLPLIPPVSANFLSQAKSLGLKKTLLSGDALISDVVSASQGGAEGIYLTNIYPDSQGIQKIEESYRSMFNKGPIDLAFLSMAYDGIQKIAEASQVGNGSLFDGLNKIFGENRSADKVEKIYQVKNNSFELVQ